MPSRLRALREDVEDQRGAIEHPQIQRALEIALLRRRQRDVEDHHVRVIRGGERADLLDLAAADVVRRIGPVAPDGDLRHRLEPGGGGELGQLFDRVGVVAPAAGNRDEQRALGARVARLFNLEDGQASLSTVMLTGRAGTTVEIACL